MISWSGADRSALLRWGVAALLLILVAHILDPWAQRVLVDPGVYNDDWGRLLRIMGFYPTWGVVAAAILLERSPAGAREGWRRSAGSGEGFRPAAFAARLLLVPAIAGGVAEIGKLAFRRLRPGEIPGAYAFREFADRPFYSGGLGFPSSHTLVAFAAAGTMARIFPRAAPVWYVLAAGCGLTRVLAGAHYLSDVVAAAVLGVATASVSWALCERLRERSRTGPLLNPLETAPLPVPEPSPPLPTGSAALRPIVPGG